MKTEATRSNDKRRLRKVLYVYAALILILIFCSKTIYTYSLPKVSVVMPQTGRLNKEIEARGVIEFAETIEICADNPGRIDELLIHEGDVVTAGTTIARLTVPKPDDAAISRIRNRLAGLELSKSDIQNRLAALEADPSELFSYEYAVDDAQTLLSRAQTEYDEAALAFHDGYSNTTDSAQAVTDAEREWGRRRTELQNAHDELARVESNHGKSFDDYEYLLAIETAEINLERRQDELETAEDTAQAENAVADAQRELTQATEALRRAALAFNEQQAENKEDAREAAGQNLTAAQTAVADAEYTYNNAVAGLGRAAEESAEDELYQLETAGIKLTDAQTAFDRANRDFEIAAAKQLENIQEERKDYNLQLNRLELDIELAGIDMLEAQPPEESFGKLTSDYGGIIISVDKRVGQHASTGERIAVAGAADAGFICEVHIAEKDARFIEIGDTAAVRQPGSGNTMDAPVTAVTLEGDTLNIKLAFESEEMNGGEYVSVKFAKQSVEYETIVPTEAVISDPVSNYVWVLASKEGALGMEYYTRKVHVRIADKDGFYTAISTGLDNYQPVVLSYDKEPVVNGRVSRME